MNPHRGLLHHLNINVSNVLRSSLFYGPVLRYLGYELVEARHDGDHHYEDWGRYELETPHMISLCRSNEPLHLDAPARQAVGRFTHCAFGATERADIDRFYTEVLVPLEKAGLCVVEDPPCECPEYGEGYYATFFFDPDGIKYEFVTNPGYAKRKRERLEQAAERWKSSAGPLDRRGI
jgi:catechol 2,3-dioxygenase-like lactoylglutathione lyase family enzyme